MDAVSQERMDSEQTTLSLEQVFGVLRRRAPWILLCFVLATAAAYGLSKQETKKYTATASLSFTGNSLTQQIAGLSGSNGSSPIAQLASDVELVKLGDMAARTASLLGHGLTTEGVSSSLTISAQGESGVVGVSAISTSPVFASQIVNTYVQQFVKEQQSANRQYFKAALAVVRKQLARMTPAQRIGQDGLELQNRAQTLTLISELGYATAQVAQEALVPTVPSSPKTKRNTILGAVLGLLLGLFVALLLERFDRRIRDVSDLEGTYCLPLLGVVPKSAALARSGQGKDAVLPPADAEVFNLIRAHLRFLNVDRELRAFVVASAAPGDGKTTVARHLAEAAARSGSRVLLLEVDLRHPTLARQLGVQTGPGLADVLIGSASIGEAAQSVDLQVPYGEGAMGRKLDVLVAGAVPPNPGELLESRAMDAVLGQAKLDYELVVIDTPPLEAVSDAFPLLTKVDGVVIVGWIGRSRRDAAERLQQVLASSGARLLGVIANGSKSGAPTSYAEPSRGGTTVPVSSTNGASPAEQSLPTART
jgi:polysaccharide biosynthesis transport protein